MSRPGPSPQSPVPGPFCLVHIHGWDGNFYENRFIDHAADACGRLGIAFAAFNNRGHDYIADILRNRRSQKSEARNQKAELELQREQGSEGSRDRVVDSKQSRVSSVRSRRSSPKLDYVQVGGMLERFGECLPDVKVAIDFAQARGCRKVFLQGHSLGAAKATYYLAKTHDPRVAGLVLLSPADALGWIRTKLGRVFPKALAHAQRLIRQGHGTELMPLRLHDSPVSARTFVEAYGPKSLTGIFNISRTDRQRFPELAAITVPALLTVGTVEEYFVGTAQRFIDGIAECLEKSPSFTGIVISGAPHNYLGHESALADELEGWLRERTRHV